VAAELPPGSNRRHHLSRGDWRFLLPALPRARVLVLGVPSVGELSALCADASLVVVCCAGAAGKLTRDEIAGRAPDNLAFVRFDPGAPLPMRTGVFDLLVICGLPGISELLWPAPAYRDAVRVLAPAGVAYLETRTPGGAALVRRWARLCLGGRDSSQQYWTIRRKGSVRAVLPIDAAPALAEYFFGSVLYGRSHTGRLLTTAARALARMRLLHCVLIDRSFVVLPAMEGRVSFPYIRRLGLKHGYDLRRHRIALLTNGSYDSNKNGFFTFAPGSDRPGLIVKVTRAAAFNHRLEREYAALRTVHERGLAARGTYPEAVFLDRHGQLAMLAETIVEGVPFRTATTAKPDCAAAHNAIAWITELGARSAASGADNRLMLCDRFTTMLERAAAVYQFSAGEQRFLSGQVAALRGAREQLPLVFRHADAGTWNVVVTPTGAAAFLDWELSETAGPPLWDLLDFVRSFGNWMVRLTGEPDPVRGYARTLDDGGLSFELQLASVHRYCAIIGVHGADIEPLFYLYWVDRALRQAAWADGNLADASYIRLLRCCLERRDSSSLRRLFSWRDEADGTSTGGSVPGGCGDAGRKIPDLRRANGRGRTAEG
jgi:SAM-dependent methyltransferase